MVGELEETIRRLRELASRKPLSPEELEEAKKLMSRLRELGFTNREVSQLTDGGWSEPTVKLYTRGTRVVDPSPRDNVISLLGEIVDRGLGVEDIERVAVFLREMESRGIKLSDVISFIDDAKKSGTDIKSVIDAFMEVKKAGLSTNSLKDILSYRTRLESMGITIDGLEKLLEISERLGGYTEVLKAIELYGEIEEIKSEIDRLSKERDSIRGEIESLNQTVKSLEERRKSIEDALKIYEELQKRGFDYRALESLRDATVKYGGPSEVLEAVKAYGELSSMKTEISRLEEVKKSLEVEIKKLEADHAHLQSVIDVCDKLLYKYRLGVSAVESIYRIAKSYGEPTEVLRAMEKYGELKKIESEIEALSRRRDELESRVKELEGTAERLRGTIEELNKTVGKLVKSLSGEVKTSIESITGKFVESVNRISSEYENYAKRFGELKAEAGRLEEELMLARVIQSLIKYPSEAKNIPLDYDIMMIKAIIKHCTVKGVNPRIKPLDSMLKKYTLLSSMELIDILEWAHKGLVEALRGEKAES